jgi:membrane protease YdiL (CAAX protease family)
MSFEAASGLAQVLGVLLMLLWLLLPIDAALSIRRRRRNRPGSSCWFAYLAILGWAATLVAFLVLFVSGRWYGENGLAPQQADIEAMALLIVLIVIHLLLIAAAGVEHGKANAAR